MKAVLLLLGLAAASGVAWAAPPREPLEAIGAILGGAPSEMGSGIKADSRDSRDCQPATASGCFYTGMGVRYWVAEGRIGEFWMTKVGGRFRVALPFGLTGSEDLASAKRMIVARRIKVEPTADYPNILYVGPVHVNGGNIWFHLDFGRSGRLDKVRAQNFEDCDGQ